MKNQLFSGSAAALITPFTDDAKDVDRKAFEKILFHQLECGTDAVVVCGTTGESPTLSKQEKDMLFSSAVALCSGKIPVIAGTGSNDTWETVRRSNDAEKKGVDALLIVTPFYNKCTQEGAIKHYFTIADRVSVPVIVYNVPSRTGFNIAPQTYKALASHKRIRAVKEADPDISKFIAAFALCSDELDFYSGNDDLTCAMMTYGAKGVISVAANVIPSEMHEITSLSLVGDHVRSARMLLDYYDLIKSMFCEVNPIPVKYASSLLYGISPSVRAPLTELSDKNKEIIRDLLTKIN